MCVPLNFRSSGLRQRPKLPSYGCQYRSTMTVSWLIRAHVRMHCTCQTIGLEINSEFSMNFCWRLNWWRHAESRQEEEAFGEASSSSFRWASHRNDANQFLLSAQSVNWPRQSDREHKGFGGVSSFSEYRIRKIVPRTFLFCKRRPERATGRRHKLRQPCSSAGDASRHVHSPAVQASALFSRADRSWSRFSCRASECGVALPSGN